jgi:hypothetical protein
VQLRQRRIVGGIRRRIAPAAQLDEIELNVVDRDRALRFARALEKKIKHRNGRLRIFGSAFDAKLMTSPRNRDIELGLDLPQIGVERAGYVRQVGVAGVGRKP